MISKGYVPAPNERDIERINRAVRNLYEIGVDADSLASLTDSVVTLIASVSDLDTRVTSLEDDPGRELLTADRTYYVRTDGSDSNDGLADNSTGALRTINKAIDLAVALDPSIYNVLIQVGAGTWTDSVNLKYHIGTNSMVLQGDSTTPANVLLSTTNVSAITAQNVWSPWIVRGFKIQTTTLGYAVNCVTSRMSISHIEFGTMASGYSHINVQQGSRVNITSNYTYSGNAAVHWNLDYGATLFAAGLAITCSGSRTFTYFAQVRNLSLLVCNNDTFPNSASVTATRFNVMNNSVIDTLGAGAAYLPGNTGGSSTAGGQYV